MSSQLISMQSINIYLMRHAETDLNKLKIVQVSCENISNKKNTFSLHVCDYFTDINNLFIICETC